MSTKIPVALQAYSVRDDCRKDFFGTLKALAEMGYEGVELAGFYDTPANELKKVLDDLGLRVAGSHTGLQLLLEDDKRQETIEYNQVLDNKFLIVPGLPEKHRDSVAAWRDTAGIFNDLAGKLAEHGMVTGYHNHWTEFVEMEGQVPWLVLGDNTNVDVVLQLDIGHALRGGGDPVDVIRKYPGRSRTVHLKDYSRENGYVLMGEGDVNWGAVYEACETVGATEWYIVEQEEYPLGPLETVKKCLDGVRAMGR